MSKVRGQKEEGAINQAKKDLKTNNKDIAEAIREEKKHLETFKRNVDSMNDHVFDCNDKSQTSTQAKQKNKNQKCTTPQQSARFYMYHLSH